MIAVERRLVGKKVGVVVDEVIDFVRSLKSISG